MLKQKNKIIIFDTTLRDGELTPGIQFDFQQKKEIALSLENLGIDIIEVGYPGKNDRDIQDIFEISQVLQKATICGLSRCQESEVMKFVRAIKPASRGRINLYSNVRPLSKSNEKKVLWEIERSLNLARNYCDDIQWTAFDATRSDINFLCQTIAVALENGAKTICIPDSLGVAVPEKFANLIEVLYDRVSNLDRAIFSVHCHDDRGMAVENTMAAIESGVGQVECTIDGLGARKGNTDLACFVHKLIEKTDYKTSIQTSGLSQVSALVRHAIEVNKGKINKVNKL